MPKFVDQIAELTSRRAGRRRQIVQKGDVVQPPEERSDVPSSVANRREAFKRLVGGTVGAVAAGGAASVLLSEPAAALDGGNLVIGNDTQTAQTETALVYNGSPGGSSIFTVTDSADGVGAALSPNSSIAGWCSGLRNIAVSGYSRVNRGVGVYASSELGAGIIARGGVQANVQLFAEGSPGPERTTSHNVGELVCDSSGDLWFSIGGGNPGTWRRISGPSTAGGLVVLPEPLRAYDSRSGAKLAADSTTTISLLTGRNGAGTAVSAVPAGSSAAVVNVTLTGTVGSFGFLQVYSGALASPPATSAVNWSAADQSIANEITVAVSPTAQIKLRPGVGSTHVIVDVVGYYR